MAIDQWIAADSRARFRTVASRSWWQRALRCRSASSTGSPGTLVIKTPPTVVNNVNIWLIYGQSMSIHIVAIQWVNPLYMVHDDG